MRLSIPHDLVLRPVTELGLSVAISNALLFNNVRVLGELDGFDEERLLRLRNLGPTKVAQLLRTIQALVDIFTNHGDGPPSEKSEDNALARAVESDGGAAVPAGALAVPPHLATCRTESLCTWPIITTKLLFHGLATLERLNRIPKSSLQSLGLSQAAVSELERAIAELGAIPQSSINLLAQARQDGTILVPALAPQTLCALANADSLESEILGLVNSLNDRDAALALGRWGFRSWPVPTLEDLGAEFKITRERVRQVLERFESRLKSSGLRLRLGSRVPEVLDSAGGVLAIEDLRRRLAAAGLHASLPALRALSRVAALGIAPPVHCEGELWFSTPGMERWFGVAGSEGLLGQLRKRIGKELRATGAVAMEHIASISQVDAEVAVRLLAPSAQQVFEVAGHLVPVPPRSSRLLRSARKMLAVTREISLRDFYSGLRRRVHKALDVPPLEVVEAVLSRHPQFVVKDGTLGARKAFLRRKVLSPSEVAGVALLEKNGGAMLWNEFVDGIVAAGFSQPTAHVVLHSVFIRSPASGIYALRGRQLAAHLIEARRRARQAARANGGGVIDARWAGGRLIVRYRLSRFSLAGVLATPRQLKPAPPLWRARFPDGRTADVKMANGLIWPLYAWFKRVGAKEGDLVVAAFAPTEGLMEMDHVPAEG